MNTQAYVILTIQVWRSVKAIAMGSSVIILVQNIVIMELTQISHLVFIPMGTVRNAREIGGVAKMGAQINAQVDAFLACVILILEAVFTVRSSIMVQIAVLKYVLPIALDDATRFTGGVCQIQRVTGAIPASKAIFVRERCPGVLFLVLIS